MKVRRFVAAAVLTAALFVAGPVRAEGDQPYPVGPESVIGQFMNLVLCGIEFSTELL
jgi:hypothetical protein